VVLAQVTFFEPRLRAVVANESERRPYDRPADTKTVLVRLEARAVVGINPPQEFGGGEVLLWTQPQNLCSIPAALHQAAAKIAQEGRDLIPPRASGLMRTDAACAYELVLVITPFPNVD
jgi:hypothetical protein